MVRVEVICPPDGNVGVEGEKFHVIVGSAGTFEAVRLTEPERPFVLFRVTNAWPGEPTLKVRELVFEAILKSPTLTVTVTECSVGPLAPVTVRV
jgi:hypothetical protein